ncbi:MAG: hypothetical protein GWN84_18240 [Gammaproteobacteria bacterium]|nr:hypothetical protein [Gammaproteobacteria bacterium]NIR84772.1 hypothetical protein [Gammaproteobacteria bacterium]NIR91291.1 hypothetical protein [Gammaproteobacteria bacterium]NIU05819.1 hypothetical protein [Gammaproteobacteria bacterium]NIV76479.1 hypothetical protein [Gammaproteobacteria bacterium]
MKHGLAAAVVLFLGPTSCSALYVYESSGATRGQGSPAQVPDGFEGSRRTYVQGIELRYDPARQVYVLLGRPGTYFHNGSFYRRVEGRWQTSESLAGGWRPASRAELPPGLRS